VSPTPLLLDPFLSPRNQRSYSALSTPLTRLTRAPFLSSWPALFQKCAAR
jgi:hypothetical protein